MAIQDMTPADLAAVVNNDDGGFGNGNGWWIILLFLFLGWGNRGWSGGESGAGAVGGNELYPWMELQQTQFNGFNGLTNAITSGFANAETAATNRQMADMQQMFSLSQQFAQCCCENRLATANLQADIAREACADRQAVSDGIQVILDKLNQDKIDEKNEQIAALRQEIALKDLAASQNLQTAQLISDNATQTSALEQYLAPIPRPAYIVSNPSCCQQWQGCGCSA